MSRDGLEVLDGCAGLPLHEVDAGENVVGLSMIAGGIGEGFVGDLGGSVEVSFEELELGELEAGQLGCGTTQDVMAASGKEGDLLVFAALAIDVHAVDHLAHVFPEADAALFHRADLVVEVVDENPTLTHGEIDRFAPDGFGLSIVRADFGVVTFEIGTRLHGGGQGARVWVSPTSIVWVSIALIRHSVEKRNDLCFIGVFERGVLNGSEQGLEAFHRLSSRVDQRLDLIVEIGVADIVHVDGAERVSGRGGDDDVIVRVDAGVGGGWSEHRLQQDEEAAAIVAADGQMEKDVGVENYLCERSVHEGRESFVLRTVFDPDGVEMDVFGEGAEPGKDVDDRGGVGRKLGLVDGRGELRRRRKIKGQRDVLGEVEAAVVQRVVADVGAECVAAGARGSGGGDFGVDLFADLLTDWSGVGEVGVVAADMSAVAM